jgi:acyl carrier protein
MSINAIESVLCDFLVSEVFAEKLQGTLEPEDSLFELGVIDSLAVVKTVAFCEEQFQIEIPDEDLVPDNFETVRAIAEMIERLSPDRS